MTEFTPSRRQIQARRKAIADSAAHYRREFNRGTLTVATCLECLQADCEHPEEAIVKNFMASHFEQRCSDCGALNPRPPS